MCELERLVSPAWSCLEVTLAFKVLEERSTCLAAATSCCTRSAIVHCEAVLTVPCQNRCRYCAELDSIPPEKRNPRFQSFRRAAHHTLSYSVTGVKPRNTVYRLVNRVFPTGSRAPPWVFVRSPPLSHEEGCRLLAFLDFCVGRPFDSKQFYLASLSCLCPRSCVWAGPSYQPFPHDYSNYKGGFTCSSLCLAATQFLGLCPEMPPAHCTPAALLQAAEHAEGWITLKTG